MEGSVERAAEVPLFIKDDRRALCTQLGAAIRTLHPYETPGSWRFGRRRTARVSRLGRRGNAIRTLAVAVSKRLLHLLLLLLTIGAVQAAELIRPCLPSNRQRVRSTQTAEVRFRDRQRATTSTGTTSASPPSHPVSSWGKPELPKGKQKDDDTFGRVKSLR